MSTNSGDGQQQQQEGQQQQEEEPPPPQQQQEDTAPSPPSPDPAPAAPTPKRLRSLADIFGSSLSPEADQGRAARDGSLEALRAATTTPSASTSGQAAAPQQPPQQLGARPGDRLISQRFGYAALGGRGSPRSADGLGGDAAAALRLHPRKTFLPGDTYAPEVCVPSFA